MHTYFKPGDKVVVAHITEEYLGWENNWYHAGMDKYVNNGVVYEISSISATGIRFREDNTFGWPPNALEYIQNHQLSFKFD